MADSASSVAKLPRVPYTYEGFLSVVSAVRGKSAAKEGVA
jgi:hypothetical protein